MDGGQTKEPVLDGSPRSLRVLAVYREGCFHPSESVEIPENTRVQLQIEVAEDR
jgi:hypothetical protein